MQIDIQNPVATAVVADDFHLMIWSQEASNMIHDIQSGCSSTSVKMWRPHILWLMLYRDCMGREMHRRGILPTFPPLLARGWESWDMYDITNLSITYPGSASEAL